ncbi:MAG: beta strand repeat-containing protein [Candidatus Kapaibacterium sp.]
MGRQKTARERSDRIFLLLLFFILTGTNEGIAQISLTDVTIFGNDDLWLTNDDGIPSQLRLFEAYTGVGAFPTTVNYTAFVQGNTLSNNILYNLPSTLNTTALNEQRFLRATTTTLNTEASLDWVALGTILGNDCWLLTGNSGTNPATNFLGTTDNQALEFRVNNNTAMRIEPAAAANVIIGTASAISAGSIGSNINGGTSNQIQGYFSMIGSGEENLIDNANYSILLGGKGNMIESDAHHAFLAGGFENIISQYADHSTILGGESNVIATEATYSTILNGIDNEVAGNFSVHLGGQGLHLSGDRSLGFLANNTNYYMNVSASNTVVFGNADLWLANNDSSARQLRFYEPHGTIGAFPGTANYSAFVQLNGLANDITYALPTTLNTTSVSEERFLRATTTTLNTDAQLEWVTVGGMVGGSCWLLQGNSGTNPANDFLGTTDNTTLVLRVNNSNAMRIVPITDAGIPAPNLIAGATSNDVDQGAYGGSIGGGRNNAIHRSRYGFIGSGFDNVVDSAHYASIVGGRGNRIDSAAEHAHIGGGLNNTINEGATQAVISGGNNNTINANGTRSAILGGSTNAINGAYTTIGGGLLNDLDQGSDYSFIGGGEGNSTGVNADYAVISGGYYNSLGNNLQFSTIIGGRLNSMGDGSNQSTIVGGGANAIGANVFGSVISGGATNSIVSTGYAATISGGVLNLIDSGTHYTSIAGGVGNTIEANTSVSSIGGGTTNRIKSDVTASVITGGYYNVIEANARYSTIAGGAVNYVDSDNSTILGGRGLTLQGDFSLGFQANNATGSKDMTVSASSTVVFGNSDLWLANNDNVPSQLRFYEAYNTSGAFPNSANFSSFEAQDQDADIEYILPVAAGSVGDLLSISAIAGTRVTLAWAAPCCGNTIHPANDGEDSRGLTSNDIPHHVVNFLQSTEGDLLIEASPGESSEIKVLREKIESLESEIEQYQKLEERLKLLEERLEKEAKKASPDLSSRTNLRN